MERKIAPSELIINEDGSVFHLHVKPEMLTDNVILVGDPGRVNLVASFFDKITGEVSSREFHTISGEYKGKPISAFLMVSVLTTLTLWSTNWMPWQISISTLVLSRKTSVN